MFTYTESEQKYLHFTKPTLHELCHLFTELSANMNFVDKPRVVSKIDRFKLRFEKLVLLKLDPVNVH